MVERSLLFGLTAAAMVAGTLPPAWLALKRSGSTRRYYAGLAGITGIAAVAYVVMALGLGSITSDGTEVMLPRYADWLLTTMLNIGLLAVLAGVPKGLRWRVVGLDAAVILLGVAAAFAPAPFNFALVLAGLVPYTAMAYLLLGSVRAGAKERGGMVAEVYGKLTNHVLVLWTFYPLVVLLAPLGVGLLTRNTEVLIVSYLDVVSKVGFVGLALLGRRAFDDQITAGTAKSAVDRDAPSLADD
jgi:sensory rhodopsin